MSSVSQRIDQIEDLFPFRICSDCDTFYASIDSCPSCGSRDYRCSFRDHQREIIVETIEALWGEGYDNVLIEGPTGIGKSAINFVLGHLSDGAFYTTPQKSLRNQLADDDALSEGMSALRGRRDYMCSVSDVNCDECPVNLSNDDSCRSTPGCTYWSAKTRAMRSQIAALTFAYLIVDNYLPTITDDGEQISFADRELGIIDECHTLEGQVASLFAGFKASPWTVPPDVFSVVRDDIRRLSDPDRHGDVHHILEDLDDACQRYLERHGGDPEYEDLVDRCENFRQKFSYYEAEISEGRDWVVDVEDTQHPNGSQVDTLQMKPVRVDRFLSHFIWSRADKWILSTATMPYRQNPERWVDRLGLDGDTKVIRKPMPFPKERRQIHTSTMIDTFSGGGDEENWDEIVATVEALARNHEGENGLVHTASYDRAEDLVESLPGYLAMSDERGVDSDEMVERWQDSPEQILCSPSMTEGVDLKYDLCRWQVLLKVPYPNSHQDSRVAYMLDERSDWEWYYQETGLKVWQSIGRAMRAEDDRADYYVLDGSFRDVMESTQPPIWVIEALT